MTVFRNFSIFLLLFFASCAPDALDTQTIVERSITFHGGSLYEDSIVEFDFRGKHYIFERNNGLYVYHRIFRDSSGVYHDILNNDGFKRFLNEKEIQVGSDWARRYSNSINSVAYFSYLPFGLNDPAVNKKLVGEEEIDDNFYFQIEVTFAKEGGGEDYDDVFIFWINRDNYQLDYFGYSYVTDGGGIRFRKAINTREENGLVYSDYINYKGADDLKEVAQLAVLFKEGKLERLSEIAIENLEVERYK